MTNFIDAHEWEAKFKGDDQYTTTKVITDLGPPEGFGLAAAAAAPEKPNKTVETVKYIKKVRMALSAPAAAPTGITAVKGRRDVELGS